MKFNHNYLLLFTALVISGEIAHGAPKEDSMSTNSTQIGTRVAFVDIQKILPTSDDPAILARGSKEWADQMTALASSLKPGDEELQEQNETYSKGRAEFDKLRKEFEALQKSGISSPKSIQEKGTVLQAKAEEMGKLEYQIQAKMQKRQELINREVKRAQEILAPKLERIIDDILIEYDIDLILRKEAVIAFRKKAVNGKLDLTESVLEVLNENYIEEMKAKKAASKETKDNKQAPAAKKQATV